jgi:ATP-dependent DNA helicase RecQ
MIAHSFFKEKTMSINRALDILKHQFGYDEFRMNQQTAIECVLSKQDCLVLMPTGGGKSLCYQIPALMQDGLTVVVSPLIALMKDQVDALRHNGVQAAFLNSTQDKQTQSKTMTALSDGEIKLLYVAPERLLQSGGQFINFLKGLKVSLFAIDEAHCISSWGHDFRPEYTQLGRIKEWFTDVPVIALTATADKLVRHDIIERLNIEHAPVFTSSFNRPNIFYRVEPKRDTYKQLFDFLNERRDESGIIYCLSRKSVDNLANNLRSDGFNALAYHAGMSADTRDAHQEKFLKDEVKIMVATVAFGMGIDKSNVRFVVHNDLPKNLESYYQETGRAGRDGLESEALLFFSRGDVVKLKGFAQVDGNAEQSEIMLQKLNKMAQFGDLKACRRKFLLEYFSEQGVEKCGHCDNCLKIFDRFDGTVIAQKALSAVYRTNQRMGITYLVDFLRGAKTKKIWDSHKDLPTYGVGADISKENWFEYFREFIEQGYLQQADGKYPTLQLTTKSRDVLKGNITVELIKATGGGKKSNTLTQTGHDYLNDLFEELRTTRADLASASNVPPYVVFSDATLIEMATYLPLNELDMLMMSGVGDLKFEKYGDYFLDTISKYCTENKIDTRIKLKSKSGSSTKKTSSSTKKTNSSRRNIDGKSTYEATLEQFQQGQTIAEIASNRGLNPSTIEGHLIRYISSGEVELHDIVAADKVEVIKEAILQLGERPALTPIKELLGEGYDYGEIKAVLSVMGISK